VVILAAVSDQSGTENQNGGPVNGAEEQVASSESSTPSAEAQAQEAPADPLEEARAEAARLRDQLLRTAADFDNYKKRSRREQQDGEKRARDDFLRDLLPVFDNLSRAVQHAESASDVKSFAEGIAMVMRQFEDTLGKLGIERIKSVGEAFDPTVHEAIQQIETTEHPPGAVAAELQAGYRSGDRVVRPALVVVAKPPAN
jgi:molecular chaperone GrpE